MSSILAYLGSGARLYRVNQSSWKWLLSSGLSEFFETDLADKADHG
jgi:hypothetical protein